MSLRLSQRSQRKRIVIGLAIFLIVWWHLGSSSSSSSSPLFAGDVKFAASSFDWSQFTPFNPVLDIKPLPTTRPRSLPPVQADAALFKPSRVNDERRAAVRAVFDRSYQAYRSHAWLHDELTPVTGRGKDPFGGWAATLVDSLDSLWIMGFKDEFREAAAAVGRLDWANTEAGALNIFETTIRHLGGLLSAYDLSREPVLLAKAVELGEMLYVGFDTENRIPGFWLNFKDALQNLQWAGTNDPSACPASLSLEFTRLSQITGDPKYYDATDRVTRFLEKTQNKTLLPGIWPTTIDFRHETVYQNRFTLGALADSLYEYLPKMYALLGGVDKSYEDMYKAAADTIIEHMLFRAMIPDDGDKDAIYFTGDLLVKEDEVMRINESQHLTCFVGGMFGLGGKLFQLEKHSQIGERLARGCGWAYANMPTGIMPEIFNMVACESTEGPCPWDQDRWEDEVGAAQVPRGFKNARDPRYLLRPEAIESIFLSYRMTGNPEYREIAWDMFEAIIMATETKLAYSAFADVTVTGATKKLDSMESFWLAETLKYFYLIFSPPDVISLDDYVLNTEAHPLLRPKPFAG
ncbi:glycoside hydrolase [Stachybotrys elegans]|uniref:alpha-1,2-Mannosidase n=1 Tax=Stachybotrys elegans TaxID=80388 RepID=A0A8K0WTJ2_9HYPO|nr:glycoside hydrolase [Stachybotrys elegans]